MPEDDRRLPRFPQAQLSPEELERQATLLPPERWPSFIVEFEAERLEDALSQLAILERKRDLKLHAIAPLKRDLAALELKIEARRKTVRIIKGKLAGATGTPNQPGAPPPAAEMSAAMTQAPVTPIPAAPDDDDFPQGLARRFLDKHPELVRKSAARIRKAMGGVGGSATPVPGSWTANEAERLRLPKLTVPSLTTILRDLRERRLRSPISA